MANDKKALPPPKSGAVVPAARSGRDLIAALKEAAARPSPKPVVQTKPVVETKGAASTALVARVREAAARPIPIRQKPPEPKIEAPIAVEAPASLPLAVPAQAPPPPKQIVPVEIAPGQTVPVEIMPQNAGAQQPINVTVNVVNEQRGYWGPYWGPYYWPYHGCGRINCPYLRGLVCNRWRCF